MAKVIRISEAASLALHCMALLAANEGRGMQNVKQLARQTKSSEAHLAKVLGRLAKSGMVRSTRGPGGGFMLAKPSALINLLAIFEAIEGPIEPERCLLNKDSCLLTNCLFDGILGRLTTQFREHFADFSLAHFARRDDLHQSIDQPIKIREDE
jgi:Rrf2 family protein